MGGRRFAGLLPLLLVASGCGIQIMDRFDGTPVVARAVPAPPEAVVLELLEGARALDLVVADVRPDAGILALGWLTPAGDGRKYLECHGEGAIGNASLLPRIQVRQGAAGSVIEIATAARSTVGAQCVSNGRYEEMLLDRLRTGPLAPAVAVTPGGAP
jgi:hypothetical protein